MPTRRSEPATRAQAKRIALTLVPNVTNEAIEDARDDQPLPPRAGLLGRGVWEVPFVWEEGKTTLIAVTRTGEVARCHHVATVGEEESARCDLYEFLATCDPEDGAPRDFLVLHRDR